MGARGPKPLPDKVHRIRGNASKKPLNELGAVEPIVEIPGCPAHLLPEARKEWKRITPELEELGLIAKIDRAALALYCQAYAWWVWHERGLQHDIKLANEQRVAFEKKARENQAIAGELAHAPAWTGGDGFTIPTPNGSFTYNPHWVGKNKAAEQVDKFLQSFGLSPSARARVTPSDIYPYLPGMEPKAGEEKRSAPIASLADFRRL